MIDCFVMDEREHLPLVFIKRHGASLVHSDVHLDGRSGSRPKEARFSEVGDRFCASGPVIIYKQNSKKLPVPVVISLSECAKIAAKTAKKFSFGDPW